MATFRTTYQDDAHITKIDNGTTDVYIWVAIPWTGSSEPLWSIKKITKWTPTVILHADWNAQFDKVWDDRVSYTYS